MSGSSRPIVPKGQLPKNFGLERLSPGNIDSCLTRRGIALAVAEACRAWQPGGDLLDIGCGSQPYRSWVEERGLSYTGIDWWSSIHTPEFDDTIRWDLNASPWPLPDAAYDAILCTEVLEHVPDPPRLMAECARVCRPGGLMLLTSPMVWPEHEAPHDYQRFTRFGLRRLCERAGFRVERLEPRGGWNTAMAQLIGFWVCNYQWSFRPRRLSKHLGWPSRLLAWPVVAALAASDRRGGRDVDHLLTLGYTVFARREPSAIAPEPVASPGSP